MKPLSRYIFSVSNTRFRCYGVLRVLLLLIDFRSKQVIFWKTSLICGLYLHLGLLYIMKLNNVLMCIYNVLHFSFLNHPSQYICSTKLKIHIFCSICPSILMYTEKFDKTEKLGLTE